MVHLYHGLLGFVAFVSTYHALRALHRSIHAYRYAPRICPEGFTKRQLQVLHFVGFLLGALLGVLQESLLWPILWPWRAIRRRRTPRMQVTRPLPPPGPRTLH